MDPTATGVLVLGIGSGTKQLHQFLGSCKKSYEAVILFGAATDSYDSAGKVIGRKEWGHITEEKVEEALGQFRGKIMQKPPIFSALRVGGKRFYEYARAGQELPKEIEERPMEVESLELVEWMESGTHGYSIPKEDAGVEAKTFAKNLLHLKTEDGTSKEQPPDASSNLKDTDEPKRKRDDPEKPTDVPGSESKKLKHADPEVAPETKEDQSRSEASPQTPEHKESIEQQSETKDIQLESDAPSQTPEHPKSAEKPPEPDAPTQKPEHPKPVEQPSEPDAPTQTPEHPKPAEQHPGPSHKDQNPPAVRIRVTASSGFYVRSLCHDLGSAVGSLAFMAELVRTQQGMFKLGNNVLEYDELGKGEENWSPQVDRLLTDWKKLSEPKAEAEEEKPEVEAEEEESEHSSSSDE